METHEAVVAKKKTRVEHAPCDSSTQRDNSSDHQHAKHLTIIADEHDKCDKSNAGTSTLSNGTVDYSSLVTKCKRDVDFTTYNTKQ